MKLGRPAARTFRDLIVWQKAHEYALATYGSRKRGKADNAHDMNIAEVSIEECQYYLIPAEDLGYGQTGALMNLLEQVSRLVNA